MSRHRRQSLKRRRRSDEGGAFTSAKAMVESMFGKTYMTSQSMNLAIAQPWKCACGVTHPPNRYRCKKCRQASPVWRSLMRRVSGGPLS